MKYLIITGNPKKDGLCFDITEAIRKGAAEAGADVSVITVDSLKRCQVCGDGWGTCRGENKCVLAADGFDKVQTEIKEADAFCIITPVYWGEMAETLKSFIDRLRRCEFGAEGALSGKPVLLVASPGGSGNGMLNCLEQMDRFCRHAGAVIYDYIGVNRWNSDYKKVAAYSAAKTMVEGRKPGDTVQR